MRDPKRIKRITDTLRELWEKQPDSRFYQFLINEGIINDTYENWIIEDEKIEEHLKKRLKTMNKLKCEKCGKEYKPYMLNNYNLGLCPKCYEREEKENIAWDETVDNITHEVTCPLCGRKYGPGIVDKKCKTKNCPVHFFWGELDCNVYARWRKKLVIKR